MTVLAPSSSQELISMLRWSLEQDGPCVIRYPKSIKPVLQQKQDYPFKAGKWLKLKDGSDAVLLAAGSMVPKAIDTAHILEQQGISTCVVNCSTVKPLDEEFLSSIPHDVHMYTMEEHMLAGGFGEYVSRYCLDKGCNAPDFCYAVRDCYIQHGDHERLIRDAKLDAESLAEDIYRRMKGEETGGR